MFTGALQAGGQAKGFTIVILESGSSQLRFAFGERAGFVDDQGVDFFENFQSFGIFDEHARASAAADTNHDRHRRGETEGAGARDDEHGDGVHQSVGETGLRAEEKPRDERYDGDGYDDRDKPFGDTISEALDGSAAALSLAYELHDARK